MSPSQSLRAWWQRLERRERWLVGIAASLLLLTIVQVGYRTGVDGIERLRGDVAQRRSALQIAMSLARSSVRVADHHEPLLSVAERVARGVGVGTALRRLEQGEDGRVRARFEGATFGAVVRWLGSVQQSTGADIESLSIERAVADGLVDASVTLTTGAP